MQMLATMHKGGPPQAFAPACAVGGQGPQRLLQQGTSSWQLPVIECCTHQLPGAVHAGRDGGHQIEARPGDWECPECGKVVFRNKSECFSCGAPKPEGLDDGFGGGGFGGGQKLEARPGDWECPECGKLVFRNKSECFSCGAPKPEGLDDGFGGGGFGGGQKFEARPGDWKCPECGKSVFKNKSECFSCGAPKPEGLDDGFGGGGFGGGQKLEARPGDWECPECGKLVFRNKSECFSCGAPKPEGLDDGFGGGGSGYGEALMSPLCACFLQGMLRKLMMACCSALCLPAMPICQTRSQSTQAPVCMLWKNTTSSPLTHQCLACFDSFTVPCNAGGGSRPGDWNCPECNSSKFANR